MQVLLGAVNAAAMDVNTACTSFLYGLSTATAMIRTGVVRNALVIGVEMISPYMDWANRNVAVLFGDGCAAVVLQASDTQEGVLGEQLGCYRRCAPDILRVRGMGCAYANRGVQLRRHAVGLRRPGDLQARRQGHGAGRAEVLAKCGVSADEIDLVVPHQANLRIIEVGRQARRACRWTRCSSPCSATATCRAATVPVALVDALEEGRVQAGRA